MEWEVSLIFDIETNGLLHDVSTIHCLAIHDLSTDQTIAYNDTGSSEPISRGLQRLQDADRIIGHNIIGYDVPVIRKLYHWFDKPAHLVDTLLLSRLYHPDMINLDKKHNWEGMPLKLYGKHSLESYGYSSMNIKVTTVPLLIGRTGHKKWRIIAYKTLTLPPNYGIISSLT